MLLGRRLITEEKTVNELCHEYTRLPSYNFEGGILLLTIILLLSSSSSTRGGGGGNTKISTRAAGRRNFLCMGKDAAVWPFFFNFFVYLKNQLFFRDAGVPARRGGRYYYYIFTLLLFQIKPSYFIDRSFCAK